MVQSSSQETKASQRFLITELKYHMQRGLAVRGHKEEEGNLYQLLKCQSDDVPGKEMANISHNMK